MKLVVGLGNPGREYEKTRHNVGFLVLDNYIDNATWQNDKDASYIIQTVGNEKVCFLKPLTFMNLSGYAVSRIVNYYKININDVLVIQDDLDLKPGSYKLKKNSSHGGHNGVKSIIEQLGSNEFARLKIGIGKAKGLDTARYVLNRLSEDELVCIKSETYKKIIDSFITDGIDKTMNIYNTK